MAKKKINPRTMVYVPPKNQVEFESFVNEVKERTEIRNFSYSKLCVLGPRMIMEIYEGLTKKEIDELYTMDDFIDLMMKKISKIK